MNCVFSYNAPWHDSFLPCIKSVEIYCKKYNLDYILLSEQKVNWKHYFCERFYFVELLEKYDRVLYLDADVLITPKAENIFDLFSGDKFCAFDENFGGYSMGRDHIIEPILHLYPNWIKNELGYYRFFNAGVMLISKNHLFAFKDFKEKALEMPDEMWKYWFDQTYLNFLVSKNNLPFENITKRFNRMSMGEKTTQEERFSADFIHYAGLSEHHGSETKSQLMFNEWKILYG